METVLWIIIHWAFTWSSKRIFSLCWPTEKFDLLPLFGPVPHSNRAWLQICGDGPKKISFTATQCNVPTVPQRWPSLLQKSIITIHLSILFEPPCIATEVKRINCFLPFMLYAQYVEEVDDRYGSAKVALVFRECFPLLAKEAWIIFVNVLHPLIILNKNYARNWNVIF